MPTAGSVEGGSLFILVYTEYWLFMEGAARLHEFIIKVCHPDPEHASKISLHLHVKWEFSLSLYLSAQSESPS